MVRLSKCRTCGVEYKVTLNSRGKFCSRSCWYEYMGQDKSRAPLCKLGYGGHTNAKWLK